MICKISIYGRQWDLAKAISIHKPSPCHSGLKVKAACHSCSPWIAQISENTRSLSVPHILPRHRYFNTYNMLFINRYHCRCWPLVEHFTVVCFHGCLPMQHKSCICWYESSMWEILYHAVSQRKVRSLQETELPLSIFGSLLSFVLFWFFFLCSLLREPLFTLT